MTLSELVERPQPLPLLDDYGAFHEAEERLSFELSYRRAKGRTFYPDSIDGPDIPNSYNPSQKAPGEWSQPDLPEDPTLANWVRHFLLAGVNEAVHEALEWYKLDGRALLDPHGRHEIDIYNAVEELVDKLFAMTEGDERLVVES